ncbi:MAG: high-potential iron-sulfur protein [Myxococcota bacterium]
MNDKQTRRGFFKDVAILGAAATGSAWALAACKKGGGEGGTAEGGAADLTCTDTSGLTEEQITTRMNSEYVDSTPVEGKTCDNCIQYEAPDKEGTCGGCKVIAGPVHPKGYCKLWAKMPA